LQVANLQRWAAAVQHKTQHYCSTQLFYMRVCSQQGHHNDQHVKATSQAAAAIGLEAIVSGLIESMGGGQLEQNQTNEQRPFGMALPGTVALYMYM
jgi:hypothetical protein